ncbi:2-oxoglutarate dehydrogenase E2 component (dihydrolipoamide succinyltransferase) [Sphingobacterium nematocida]|uniref:Dihydrolipoamide acetyltransferase component of pyruvate dehydrogenase complex n=1 Tax=Sphingobacterium nematocida TaxID=1513896 RepID=A0A1T5CAP0_9SPHI|nr:dihydrolipoamide acetyltransferase family protein [Sphingobacterium nematocida]SKB56210.1 2-oxoglutarate dehydrogenase E2 component (dihydrolipoamide succinyltransferase) [Sphingobacterium nematocida]
MGIFKLVLPKMGESVSEATLTKWVKAVGDRIEEDDTVVEVATDKVDSEVPSPVQGILKEILFEEGRVAQVGDVIALLEIEGGGEEESIAVKTDTPAFTAPAVETSVPENPIPGIEILENANSESSSITRGTSEERFYSPLVKSIAQQEGLSAQELETIAGSGSEGRVTKQDVLDYIKLKSAGTSTIPQVSAAVENTEVRGATTVAPVEVVKATNGDEIIEMDRMRRLIADHMVNSIRTSPHVFSVVEADVTNLVNWRNKVKDNFKKREGENITFTPLIIEAITKALKDFPMINVSVDGNNIIKRKHINIGMAAALPSGNLIVPVIKDADQLSLVGISKAVNDLANRARGNKLKPDDTQGGTFTFTNIGAFGNIFGMPIINQPQAAILAVGTITKKPAVLETPDGDVIAIRHMMYLTMSYDHRVIDGALGGTFLKRVGDYLENWDKEREV